MDNEGKAVKTQNILLGILIGIALAVAFMFYQQTEKQSTPTSAIAVK